MELIKIVEMTPIKKNSDNEPVCYNSDCAYYGMFDTCYFHTYAFCEEFDKFYESHRRQILETKHLNS